jgi:hypothetical protein
MLPDSYLTRVQKLSVGPFAATAALTPSLKPAEIILNRHGQLQQSAQQFFRAFELNAEFPSPQVYARQLRWRFRRGGMGRPAYKNRMGARRRFGFFQALRQTTPAHALLPEFTASFQRLKVPEQGIAINQEGLAGLVTAKPVQEFNGAPTPHLEDLLNGGAIQDRCRERGHRRPNGGKL